MFLLSIFSALLFTVTSTKVAPTEMPMETMESAVNHLRQFGYLTNDSMPSMLDSLNKGDMEPFRAALRIYQLTFSLPVTGELDNATQEMMSMPRCGMSDEGMIASTETHRRSRRYTLSGTRWPKTDLTYFIETSTTDLPKADVENEIKRAFETWSAVSPLRFYRANNRDADIIIKFGARSHGDPYPFNGPGGVLAHAFYPTGGDPTGGDPTGGDAHFDEDETWTIRTYQGVNLYQVAVHEFGHSLGIRHSAL